MVCPGRARRRQSAYDRSLASIRWRPDKPPAQCPSTNSKPQTAQSHCSSNTQAATHERGLRKAAYLATLRGLPAGEDARWEIVSYYGNAATGNRGFGLRHHGFRNGTTYKTRRPANDRWDHTQERARGVGEGVEAMERLQDAAGGADVVVTMVADAAAVLSVMDEQGGLSAMKPGSTWVQMATIGLDGITRAKQLAARCDDVIFVDAPVSGTKGPAEEGKLLLLASSDQSQGLDNAQAFFNAVGQRTVWLGPAGQGTRMKLVLNTWLAELMEALAETLATADALGITSQQLAQCIEGGPLAAPWAIAKLKKIENGATADTEFPLKWATKDVHLALEAVSGKRDLPALKVIAHVWDQATSSFGDQDVSAAYLALQSPHIENV